VRVRAVFRGPGRHRSENICADLRFTSGIEGSLVLIFPQRTAEALADRMLAGVSIDVGDQLIRDCAGEIGNVVAGQAKALLSGRAIRLRTANDGNQNRTDVDSVCVRRLAA